MALFLRPASAQDHARHPSEGRALSVRPDESADKALVAIPRRRRVLRHVLAVLITPMPISRHQGGGVSNDSVCV